MRSPHTSYRWRGERVIEPNMCMPLTTQSSVCSHHTPATGGEEERVLEANQVYALTTHRYRWRGERDIEPIKCMLSPHTSYRWRGERVIETIKCMLSPHTSYRWRGERDIHMSRERHRANQVFSQTKDCTTFTWHDLTVFYVERMTAHCVKLNDHSCFHNSWPNSKTKLKLKHIWEPGAREPCTACVLCVYGGSALTVNTSKM